MKDTDKINKKLDELDDRIADAEKAKLDSSKRKKGTELDPALNVECFWSWYRSTIWHKKKIQMIINNPKLGSIEESLKQYYKDVNQKIEAFHNALCIALSNKWIPYQPSFKQFRFLMLPDKEAFYGGAAGGGKSDALLMGAIMFCHLPDYHAILFRKTLEDHKLSSSLIPRSKKWLVPVLGKKAYNGSTNTWTFPGGATISFGYLNNVDDHFRYQSTEFQFIGFDELPHIPENQFRYLFSRLRRLESQVHIPLRMRGAGNPEGKHVLFVYRRYVNLKTSIAPFVPAKIGDNPGLDKESYFDSLSNLDPITQERLKNGNWEIADQGLKFNPKWFIIVKDYPRGYPVVRYWDKASTEPRRGRDPDWTVGVKATMVNGVFFVLHMERFRGRPLVNESRIRKIAERDGKAVKIFMEQEPGSAGVNDIDNYARKVLLGFSFRGVKTTDSKIVRADPLSAHAERGDVKLVEGNWINDFLDEFEVFPLGAHDDIVDATSGVFNELPKYGPVGGDVVDSIFSNRR